MKTVGIIGASGYVGQHIARLLAGEFRVTALQRNAHAVLPFLPGVTIQQIDSNTQTFDILVNTSYYTGPDRKSTYLENERILQLMRSASHPGTHVIHLSSLAVFGIGLDRNITTEPVSLRPDHPYVHSKVHMENLLLKHFPHNQLSMIRLGNVWGAANNSWTQPVADALQWGLPVLSSSPAFSNITYVHNIADYVRYIMMQQNRQLFHHLAEFSAVTWQEVIGALCRCMQVQAAPIMTVPFYAITWSEEWRNAWHNNPLVFLRRLKNGRFTAHYFPHKWFKDFLSLYQRVRKRKTAPSMPGYERADAFFLVLSGKQAFISKTLPGWIPPHSWKEVETDTCNWLHAAGFISR